MFWNIEAVLWPVHPAVNNRGGGGGLGEPLKKYILILVFVHVRNIQTSFFFKEKISLTYKNLHFLSGQGSPPPPLNGTSELIAILLCLSSGGRKDTTMSKT